MCAIYGFLADRGHFGNTRFLLLKENAADRGRDEGAWKKYHLHDGRVALLGHWRATPTVEIQHAPPQPYDGVVHNGTIANDKELGGRKGEVDSMVLPRVLQRQTLTALVESLKQVKGSYALAVWSVNTVYLACNYKPLYYWRCPGEGVYFSSMERHFAGVCSKFERPAKLEPYTALDLTTGESQPLPQEDNRRAVIIESGGLDSTVAAAMLKASGYDIHLLHFLYGCKAETKEEGSVTVIADAMGVPYSVLPVNFSFGAHSRIPSILLGDDAEDEIGTGRAAARYAVDWVPARNLVMLSLATAFAEANGFHTVALGNNLEESGAFPDNEEEFTHLFNSLLPNACQNGYRVQVESPVGRYMKGEIVRLGILFEAPLEHTWSCYRSQEVHCGQCASCFIRREAFKRNKVKDPAFNHQWNDPYWEGCRPYEEP